MTLDRVKINERLEKLKEYTHILKEYQSYTYDEFVSNQITRTAIERYFQLAIECIIDIGEILISNLGLKKPEKATEVILILGEAKIIPDEFVKDFSKVTGFRNILVHDYLSIDYRKVYQHLQNDLKDFNEFAKYISQYLRKFSMDI